MKRNSIGSGSYQRDANPSKDESEKETYQRSKPVEVCEESKQENKDAHKAGLNDMWLCREGRRSSKCPMGMTPLILQDQNLNFISNKVLFCLFCVLLSFILILFLS